MNTNMAEGQGISFTKMQGTGNDFLVLDNRTVQFSEAELSAFAATWCPRRYGVGGDGVLALDHPETPAADYRMHYVNADGSRATMCGNGARCLFRFARRADFEKAELAFDTDAGLYRATYADETRDHVRLFVPDITDVRSDVALDRDVPEAIHTLYFVHTGTEHLVAVVEDLEAVPVREWGRRLRHAPTLEPTGANVNFVEEREEGVVRLRTYEKGVEDETLSCGTGVLAAAVVAERLEWVDAGEAVPIQTKGGRLWVGIAKTDRGPERYLEGPAVSVFQGTVLRPGSL